MIRGVILFPGAGSGAEHPSLRAIETMLAPVPVQRVDFPYRRAGRKLPDRAPLLIAAVRDALQEACEQWACNPSDVVIGGRSMGGRMCSMAVAGFTGNERATEPEATVSPNDEPLDVAGLVCVSYPLHRPKKPTNLRVAHLPYVRVPSLFVSGTRDEFASPAELRRCLAVIPTTPEVQLVDGARHDLRGKDEVVAGMIADWVQRQESSPSRS